MAAFRHHPRRTRSQARQRRGAVMILAAFIMIGLFAFAAFSVDTGRIVLSETEMQNAVDAAALAAAQELADAVFTAGQVYGDANTTDDPDVEEAARQIAAEVASRNGVYIDPNTGVEFGNRQYASSTDSWSTDWGATPYNVVKVTARRENSEKGQPDSRLNLAFGWAVGKDAVSIVATATAYIESRDIVAVIDTSCSMNDDSELQSVDNFGQTAIEANLDEIHSQLDLPPLGSLSFTPQWLTVVGEEPTSDCEALSYVTFMDTAIFAASDKEIQQIDVEFEDGSTESFTGIGATSATVAGTGDNQGKAIVSAWVVNAGCQSSATVVGKPPTKNSEPQIEVTFYGDSIYVTSSKDLSNVVLAFDDGTHYKFDGLSGKSGTFAGIGDDTGKQIATCWIKSGNNKSGDGPGYGERFDNPLERASSSSSQPFDDTNDNVLIWFGLTDVDFPYESGSWTDFFNYCRTNTAVQQAGYRKMYGGLTLVNFLLEIQPHYAATPDLWQTSSYPMTTAKSALHRYINFLTDLGLNDQLGLVTFDATARSESYLVADDATVNLGDDLITSDFAAIATLADHKQAGHESCGSGLGRGIETARQMLVGDEDAGISSSARYGAVPTMLVISDGQTNGSPDGWEIPLNFDWNEWTDYDRDGAADYVTSDEHKQYAIWEATLARDKGIFINTISVGFDSDDDLLQAIAFIGRGTWTKVSGSLSASAIDEEVEAASDEAAARVPPPKLIYDDAKELPDAKPKGNNGVGNGEDPQPPGNPPVNDGPGTGPGNPGNKGGAKK